jgi:hypothetical protein
MLPRLQQSGIDPGNYVDLEDCGLNDADGPTAPKLVGLALVVAAYLRPFSTSELAAFIRWVARCSKRSRLRLQSPHNKFRRSQRR